MVFFASYDNDFIWKILSGIGFYLLTDITSDVGVQRVLFEFSGLFIVLVWSNRLVHVVVNTVDDFTWVEEIWFKLLLEVAEAVDVFRVYVHPEFFS